MEVKSSKCIRDSFGVIESRLRFTKSPTLTTELYEAPYMYEQKFKMKNELIICRAAELCDHFAA